MAIVGLLGGTWARDRQRPRWFEPGSSFVAALEAAGHQLPPVRHRPTWSTRLGGLSGKDDTWEDFGRYLELYVLVERVLFWIVHSHAGSGILFAAARQRVELDTVILVGTPVRDDWDARYARALKHIRRLFHVYSPVDPWQASGSVQPLNPGTWFRRARVVPGAVPIEVPGASHTGLLDPAHGWLGLLGSAEASGARP